jgi:hypothetical protein
MMTATPRTHVEMERRLIAFIPHSNDAGLDVLTCTASEVLRHGTGICFAKSHFLRRELRGTKEAQGVAFFRRNPLCTV